MGLTHIPDFESDLNEPDKSSNPWKGKNPKRPARISVDMPPEIGETQHGILPEHKIQRV